MQKILESTKDKLRKNRKIKSCGNHSIKFYGMLLIAFILIFSQGVDAIASTGVRIYNYTSKKEYTYTDRQVKVTYNGKKISVDKTPGLIESGIALVSYKDIFVRSDIKADYVYDKSAATVTISKFGITIVMKIGSKTAYINGKEVTMPVAPVKIKYINENVTKILVPSRFVAENLGFTYTWNKNTNTVAIVGADTPLRLSYNNGDEFYYQGTQGIVTIDGKTVNPGKMPSIITNNTAMLRAKRVFADSKINADYSYNTEDQTITLSRNGNTLEMKIGSPVAHLNGRAMILDTAPMIVTNHDVGTSYVMVPGSFTAACLGFDYRWDKANKTSIILSRPDDEPVEVEQPNDTLPDQEEDKLPDQKDDAPELGDSPVTFDKGTVLVQWEVDKNLLGNESNVKSIDIDQTSDLDGAIFNVSMDYQNLKYNTETYAIMSSKPFSKVSSEVNGRQIKLHASDMACINNTYNMRNYNGGLLDNVRLYALDINNSVIEFNNITEKFTYDLSLSSDKHTLYITIYYNTLNKVTIGTNNTMDYISLSGEMAPDVITEQMPGLLTIRLPDIKKGIDDSYENLFDGKNLYFVNMYYATDSTYLVVGLKNDVELYFAEDDNNYTIMFPHNEGYVPVIPETPEVPNQPQIPTDNDYPTGEDSQFELIIPNLGGLTTSQIKDEDQYSRNRFAIRLPGDYTTYLNTYPIRVNSNVIKDVSVFKNSNNETEILVSTSKLQGYEIFADNDYIYVNVGNPREIYKNIVVLDPGHGGPAPGAHYYNTYEKTINFKILYEIGKEFFNSNPSELKVYYTRESDVDLSLSDRAAFAQKVGADLFVSLHMNANTKKTVYGTEVYYSNS
ncbi:MAG: hypothetical protein GX237_00940, partial [Clostridiales bacterium]|nr:hypothetical protein [Clostridiales bacterium]